MKIAIVGSTSQIAKDLITSFAKKTNYDCTLFSRNPKVVTDWMKKENIYKPYQVLDYYYFSTDHRYDVIINFVGVGDPAKAKEMGSKIFDITYKYDMMVLEYLQKHSETKYIFLSSGAVYGGNFEQPVTHESVSKISINDLGAMDWYTISKIYAEARHRALPEFSIVDIRVFNYFSHTQDINARFLMTDILRSIQDKITLKTSPIHMMRDFIHSSDFYSLVTTFLVSPATNVPVDCYSREPIDKLSLLASMQENFGLHYEIVDATDSINITGIKPYYFSLNVRASDFGYEPRLTSLEGILQESDKFLNGNTNLAL